MKLPIEKILTLAKPILRLIKREPEARDAFGGDDLFDGDSKPSGMGPKIALAASGVMLMMLIGLIGVFLFSGDDIEPEPIGGSLSDLEIESDMGDASADTITATDRSVERRPWLIPAQGGGQRLGLTESEPAKTTTAPAPAGPASGSLPTREVETASVMKPPPAGQDTQTAQTKAKEPEPKPAAATPAEPAKSVDDLMAMTKPSVSPPPAAATPTAPTPTAPTPAAIPSQPEPAKVAEASPATPMTPPAPAESPSPQPQMADSGAMMVPAPEEAQPERQPTPAPDAMPSLLAPPGNVPGAPKRFAVDSNEDQGPDTAGGRPRLNEPRVPPIAKAAIAAPPPRFANLAEVRAGQSEPAPVTGAKIAVVVEGLGLSQVATEAAINRLPTNVTLAFSPYARDLKRWIDRAKAKGHEVLIEVPMEGKAFPAEDPGPLGLLTVLESKDNAERLDAILKEATGATGIFDAQGSKFRESEQHLNEMFAKLKEKNLFYVQGRPGIRVGEPEVPTATADVVVDERPFRAAVDARLDFAERLAKYQGSSVAVMSAKPVSYERLALWIEQLAGKGVNLTPVSGVLIQ